MEMVEKKERRQALLTKVIFIILLLVIWEVTAKAHIFGKRSEIVFPTLESIGKAFIRNFTFGYAGTSQWIYILNSMRFLLEGLCIGVGLAFIFSGLSMVSKTIDTIFNLCVSIFDLLPGVTQSSGLCPEMCWTASKLSRRSIWKPDATWV